MAGLTAGAPTPQALTLHGQSRALEVSFSDGQTFRIPFELMRVYSPSAEVQGHGPGQEVLQTGKREVDIVELVRFSLLFQMATTAVFFLGTICTIWARSKTVYGLNTTNACRLRVRNVTMPCQVRRVHRVATLTDGI
jgi:hypothetical protein